MSRRKAVLFAAVAYLCATRSVPAVSWAVEIPASPSSEPFSSDHVIGLAEALAQQPFRVPPAAPETLSELPYDTYRQIRYQEAAAVWGDSPTRFSVQCFAPGYLYEDLIDIAIVENGEARPLEISERSFETPNAAIAQALVEAGKFAGFRLHYPINTGDLQDEFVVFQGASYFRAVSSGQTYGLSARGLAIDTAQPQGEEFPIFRSFWIERPSASDYAIVVHALLDSDSVTGAFRFGLYPGRTTRIDVSMSLFPRRTLTHVGLCPLTSMFHFGPADQPTQPDYRPAVHDSEGLAIINRSGERLWRPLINPRTLQVSAFKDKNPRGFGLIQRTRDFSHYQDLEARYERRPSIWVEPEGEWGEGHVDLVEIPTDSEANDNIVAYWRPDAPLAAGQRHDFAYRLTWPDVVYSRQNVAQVILTGIGRRLDNSLPQAVIDFDTEHKADGLTVDAVATPGRIVEAVVANNTVTGGIRVFVTFDPEGASPVELRVQPRKDGVAIGETWLYRWLADQS